MILPLADPDLCGPIDVPDEFVAAFDAAMALVEAPTPLDVVRSMYDALGDNYDSLDREALFVRGVAFLKCDYGEVYEAWLRLDR